MGTDSTKYYKVQLRRDTTANWDAENPILSSGELGLDTTYNTMKIGDGQLVWGALNYVNAIYPDDSFIAKLDEFIDPGLGIEMIYYSGEKVYEISTTGLALQSDLNTVDGRVAVLESGVSLLENRVDNVEDDVEILDIKVSGLESRSTFDIEYIIRSPLVPFEAYGDSPAPSACYVGVNGVVTNNPAIINEIFLSTIDKNGLEHNFSSIASGDVFNFSEENDEDVSVRFQIDTVNQLASGVKLDVTMQSAINNGTVDDGDVYDCLVFPDVDVSDKADISYVDQLFNLSAKVGGTNTFVAENVFTDRITFEMGNSAVSMNVKGRMLMDGSSGSLGQVLTSNGQTKNAEWKTPTAVSSFSPGDQVVKGSPGSTSGSFYKSGTSLYWVP